MAQCIDYPLQTFSIGFNDERYNELPFAWKVANQFRTQQHIAMVADDRFLNLLPETIFLSDNPHGDVSFLPTYEVAALSRKHVKVVMTGDGSDEIFGGYDKYTSYMDKCSGSFDVQSYISEVSVFKYSLKAQLCHSDIVTSCDVAEPVARILTRYGDCDALNKMLVLDQQMLLEGNNLVKPDRMGMGNSIEARMPFLDHTFLEYVASIPSNLKVNQRTTKYILKKTFEGILPMDILYTPKRMFTVPVGEWLKVELRDFMYQLLCDERTKSRGYFNQNVVVNMMTDHIEGKKNYTRELRLLIILELWHRIYIDTHYNKAPVLSELVAL